MEVSVDESNIITVDGESKIKMQSDVEKGQQTDNTVEAQQTDNGAEAQQTGDSAEAQQTGDSAEAQQTGDSSEAQQTADTAEAQNAAYSYDTQDNDTDTGAAANSRPTPDVERVPVGRPNPPVGRPNPPRVPRPQTTYGLSNGMKVFLTVIFTIIPGFGQLAGIITAIVFMNSEDDSDKKSFGVAILVASLIMFVLACIGCFIIVIASASMREIGSFY